MKAFQESAETARFLPPDVLSAVRDRVWKLISVWRAAGNNHKGWFFCLAVNSPGILPIPYLISVRNKN
jgi:hypothetical protein